jgi:small subunit ribosomal protein S1
LLHISELAEHKVENPEDVVKVGEEIEVKILRVDADERKIGLSRKRVEWGEDQEAEAEAAAVAGAAATPGELKGGVGSGSGPLFKSAPSEQGDNGSPEPVEAEQSEG